MSRDLKPSSPIIQRYLNDLKLSGKKTRTQQSYSRNLRKFAEFLNHSPDQATEEQLRAYLLFLTDNRQHAPSTINVALQALKLFFRVTCPRDWPVLKLARVQSELKLPTVLSVGEVRTIIKLIEKPVMRCFFSTVYSLGLMKRCYDPAGLADGSRGSDAQRLTPGLIRKRVVRSRRDRIGICDRFAVEQYRCHDLRW